MRHQKGFSLIELLCAMVIGLVVLSVIFELVLNFTAMYHMQNALAEMQENARFASHFLRSQIESTGFVGCNSVEAFTRLQVYEGGAEQWFPTVPKSFRIKPKQHSDIIEIERGEFLTGVLVQPVKKGERRLYVSLRPTFKKKETIMLSDCVHNEKFTITSVSKSTLRNFQVLTLNKKTKDAFLQSSEVTVLHHVIYYVKETGRLSKRKKPIDALYQKEIGGRAAEVVSNINALKVSCDEMLQHRLVKITPSRIQNWQKVFFLEIYLTINAENKNFHKDYRYPFIIPLREHINEY